MPYKTCTLTAAEPWMYEPMKQLWRLCFGDSEELIDLFFERRLSGCQTVISLNGATVTGSLYLLPTTYRQDGADRPAYYLYALSVLPEFRSRGIGHQMLRAAFERCRAEGAVCLLCPAGESLAQYYESLGMKRGFRLQTVVLPARAGKAETTPLSAEEYRRLRNDCFGSREGFVQWDEDAVRFALSLNETAGGFCVGLRVNGAEYAALGHMDGRTLLIEETTLPPDSLAVLAALAAAHGAMTVRCHLPSWVEADGMEITGGMIWGTEPHPGAYLGLTLG